MKASESKGPSTDELIERWMRGDRDAGQALYDRYYRRAMKFGMALTRREMDAEDLAQEAIAAGLEAVREGKRPAQFTGWLLGVVKHVAWKRNRNDARKRPEDPRTPDRRAARASRVLIEREMSELLERALGTLTEEERDLLKERVLESAPREEIARKRNCSLDTVDRKIARATAKLREQLSGHFTTLVLSGRPPTRREVQALRPSFREAFLLHHVEGLPIPDVAARLGIPEETVHERLKYAYHRLRCGPAADFSGLRSAL